MSSSQKNSMLSDKEFAIIGMIYQKQRYGYEIEREIIDTSMREWTDIGFSSIYYILNKLEQKGFISGIVSMNEKNQARKVYSITEKGKKTLKASILALFQTHERNKWQIDLGLAFFNLLSREEQLQCLDNYEKAVDEYFEGYSRLKDYLCQERCEINRIQLAERPLFLLKAEKEWLKQLKKSLE